MAGFFSGSTAASWLASKLPSSVRRLEREVAARVDRLEIPFNRFGVDPFGASKEAITTSATVAYFFYRHYFSVESFGLENIPVRGRAMLVGNHSGGFAIDGLMIITSLLFEMEPPRLAQAMVDRFMNELPFASLLTTRTGQLTGLPEHAQRLLDAERMLVVFPEGVKGTAKLYKDRYSLVDFGTGFMRLALEKKAPIIPVAFLGGGDAVPTVANAYGLGKLLGLPYLPITPYGVAIPLPVKLEVYYGKPLHFEGTGNEDDEVVAGYVDQVKHSIATMLETGRKRRKEARGLLGSGSGSGSSSAT